MVDWKRAEELKDEVGEEAFLEVVELFLEEVDEVMTRLTTAQGPGRLLDDLHFLKGSAMSLGFKTLADRCAENEAMARKTGPDSVDITHLADIYTVSRREFLGRFNVGEAAA